MYFREFDTLAYKFNIGGKEEYHLMTDITKNVRIRKELLSNMTLYDSYIMVDGETPEIIAEKVYGHADYHWAIMLANDRYDLLNDFPLRDFVMEKVIIDKYGEEHIHDIHHYEKEINGAIYVVDNNLPNAIPITNSDFEYIINESKRNIKIISPSIINQVARELGTI